MQDKDRERRRTRRLEKQRKKRATASRPAAGGPTATFDAARGKGWDTGECYVSEGWDEPGAKVELVFSRCRADGISVVATFELDRSGPGLLGCSAIGGLRQDRVVGECARISERTGRSMVACAPGLIAALVEDARSQGSGPPSAGLERARALLEGVEPLELGVPFGPPAPEPVAPETEGWLLGLRRRLFGA